MAWGKTFLHSLHKCLLVPLCWTPSTQRGIRSNPGLRSPGLGWETGHTVMGRPGLRQGMERPLIIWDDEKGDLSWGHQRTSFGSDTLHPQGTKGMKEGSLDTDRYGGMWVRFHSK